MEEEDGMADAFKVAFIGAGSRANAVHYPSFAELEDVRIVGICDIDPERLAETAERYGVPEESRWGDTVESYRDMIRATKPDGVVCIGQPHLMYDIWVWCLEQGLNLYVEKPLGLTMHQAQMLTALAEEHGCVTTCTLQRRTTPSVMRARQECLKHGPITHALVRFYKCEIQTRYHSRDHMLDDTIHSIDALRWACGDSEIAGVESLTRRVGVRDINFISATLRFENGSVGYLVNSWSSGRRVFDIEMHAPGICAEMEHEVGGRVYAAGDTAGVYLDSAECAGSDAFHVLTGVRVLARDFVDSCRAHRQSCSPFSSAMKAMEIAEMILAQATLARR
ncbi:Gfo/Idh/MocA family oxidoreductase [Eubacteriales bacterium OttesenSCG-928-A19]|nr:Gfo/Idh/MocA family oxidoreductase [Eubacteriales bacterium OttesenSCG-928-A19]